MVLAVLVWLAAVPALAGCGGERTDLARVTYPRTVIPPGSQQPSGTNPGGSQRLSPLGLRLVDPCSLLDPAALARFGTPDDNVAQDFDGCRNYMRDAKGESLSFSVRVGETLTDSDLEKATDQLGGFKSRVSTVEGACFVTLVVEQVAPAVGVTLQTGYKGADPCPAAREIATGIAQRLSSTATLRAPAPRSLLPADPCALAGDLPATAVPNAGEPDPFGLHQCSWHNPEGVELELEFAYRFDPATADGQQRREPVDLGGGVTGHQLESDQSFAKCQLGWMHLPAAGGLGEVVEIEVRDVGDSGIDVCAAAVTFAKGLLPELPAS